MTPAYRHVGGSIVYQNKLWLDDAEVQRQADLALRDHDACLRIGDRRGARVARSVFLEITDALKAQEAWKRCASAPRQSIGRAA